MPATREDVDRWIATAKKKKYKFIISACDTFDWDDYPVYCKDAKELNDEFYEINGKNMQKVNEIIRIDGDVVTENLTIENAID
jgi:hypothetical protein